MNQDDPATLLQTRSGRCIKQYNLGDINKRKRHAQINELKAILKKPESSRSQDELTLLSSLNELVVQIDLCHSKRLLTQSHHEICVDDSPTLQDKCAELAQRIARSQNCVVYTGAGISTSASIPDYRGPNGLWTMLEKGIKVVAPDFARVSPTFSHMALASLVDAGLVKHIVSQNCDGLHLRSGIHRHKLSELHGNCFIEFCLDCYQEYVRLFDVTEKSSFRKHTTGRMCKNCNSGVELRDSIIHFGEKLRNGSPYNWDLAKAALKDVDLIICFGSSLKVLKHYSCLWPKKKSIDLCIVNIQWTPKDSQARLKVNGYADEVFRLVMKSLRDEHGHRLTVNEYTIDSDPLLDLAIELDKSELSTTTKHLLNSNRAHSHKANEPDANSSNSWYNRSFKNKKVKKSLTSDDA